jgi:hypothetical protein
MTDADRVAQLRKLAHDVRNALNGVAVNLEVARSRAQRGTEVAELNPFIASAVQQLESATDLHKRYTDLVSQMTAGLELHQDATRHATMETTSKKSPSCN